METPHPPPRRPASAHGAPDVASGGPWVRGPAWDGVWLLCAAWLVPLALLLAARGGVASHGALDGLFFVLTALFWLGHRVGSTWLAYFTTAYRPLLRAEPVRFTVVPVLIALFCFGTLLPPDAALPWTRAQRLTLLVILDYLLVTYHFASQHFGVLSLYRLRAGSPRGKGRRRLDRLYALGVGGALVVVAEVAAGTVYRIDVWIDPWLSPAWVASSAGTIRAVGVGVAGLAALAMVAGELRAGRRSAPMAAYALGMAGMVAVAFYATAPFVFLVVWSSQHWIVATALTSVVARDEPAPPGRGPVLRAAHAVNRRPWAVLALLAVASLVLLPFLEVEGVDDDGAVYAPRIFGAFATTLRDSTWAPALIALGLTTAFLHYWLDRACYRFSDARTREAARGLLAPTPPGGTPGRPSPAPGAPSAADASRPPP